MANLPHEIMVEILSRLPVKSLCRFRCVSKAWFTLISDPHFAKLHLNQNIHQNERSILISDSLHTIEYEDSSSDNSAVAIEVDISYLRDPLGWPFILGSCNGLLLVGNRDDNRHFLLNPSIGKYNELPESPFDGNNPKNPNECFSVYGLGYDSCIDDYKIVRICCNITPYDVPDIVVVSLYTLRTDCWRRIEDYPYNHGYGISTPAAFLNGAFHWPTYRKGLNQSSTIVSFDLVNENFRDLPPPSFVKSPWYENLGVLGGCLCMITYVRREGYYVYVMKEYGVKESWIRFSITCPNTDPDTLCYHDKVEAPVCFRRNGEVVWEEDNSLIIYN